MSNEIQKQIIPSLSDSGRADQPPTYEVDVEKTAAESDSNSDAGTIDPVAERRLVLKQVIPLQLSALNPTMRC